MFALGVGIASIGVSAQGSAEGRYRVIDFGDKHDTLVDIQTLRRSGNTVNYWVVRTNLAPFPDGKKAMFVKTRERADCRERTFSIEFAATTYFDNSFIQDRTEYNGPIPALPGSVGESVVAFVCEGIIPTTYENASLKTESDLEVLAHRRRNN